MKTTNELIQVPPVTANGPAMASLVAVPAGCAAIGILYTLSIASPTITRLLSWYALLAIGLLLTFPPIARLF